MASAFWTFICFEVHTMNKQSVCLFWVVNARKCGLKWVKVRRRTSAMLDNELKIRQTASKCHAWRFEFRFRIACVPCSPVSSHTTKLPISLNIVIRNFNSVILTTIDATWCARIFLMGLRDLNHTVIQQTIPAKRPATLRGRTARLPNAWHNQKEFSFCAPLSRRSRFHQRLFKNKKLSVCLLSDRPPHFLLLVKPKEIEKFYFIRKWGISIGEQLETISNSFQKQSFSKCSPRWRIIEWQANGTVVRNESEMAKMKLPEWFYSAKWKSR